MKTQPKETAVTNIRKKITQCAFGALAAVLLLQWTGALAHAGDPRSPRPKDVARRRRRHRPSTCCSMSSSVTPTSRLAA